eukprot:1521405-Prymnesium_polylepis.1
MRAIFLCSSAHCLRQAVVSSSSSAKGVTGAASFGLLLTWELAAMASCGWEVIHSQIRVCGKAMLIWLSTCRCGNGCSVVCSP